MFYWRIGLTLMLCAALPIHALAQSETKSTFAQPIKQPKPQFPKSELTRHREGWILLGYTVGEDGTVVDSSIEDSSGSDAFNKAALKAVRKWLYEPAEEQELRAFLSFVYDSRIPLFHRRFSRHYAKIQRAIDNDELDDAQERIVMIRKDDDLTPYELAYSFVAESRIAGKRGDPMEQLRCFRTAMLNEGRWVGRGLYLKLLHDAVILEIQLGDFASALRDYALLTETGRGRAIAADLAASIQAARTLIEGDGGIVPPYMVADLEMSIKREAHRYQRSFDKYTRYYPDDRDVKPRPKRQSQEQ